VFNFGTRRDQPDVGFQVVQVLFDAIESDPGRGINDE
jgi:hypothetical protein